MCWFCWSKTDGGVQRPAQGRQETPMSLQKRMNLSGASRLKDVLCSSQRYSVWDGGNFTVSERIPKVILNPYIIHKQFTGSVQCFTALTRAAGPMGHVRTDLP